MDFMRCRVLGILLLTVSAGFAEKHAGLTVMEQRCAGCHVGKAKKSGLDVTSRAMLLRGGDRGPAIVAGDAKASLLYRVAAQLAEPHMPYKASKLKDSELAALASWIDAGAPFEEKTVTEAVKPRSNHWAYQKPVRGRVPAGKFANPIDGFLAAEQSKRGLQPVGDANRRTLARRVYLDLVGVPPTREELQAFLADPSPRAYESLVDRLLAE